MYCFPEMLKEILKCSKQNPFFQDVFVNETVNIFLTVSINSRTAVNKRNFRTAISDTDIFHTKEVITPKSVL